MTVVAVDPGPQETAVVAWDGQEILWHEIAESPDAAVRIVRRAAAPSATRPPARLVIEKVESYGMAVGGDVFTTCVVTGRLFQVWLEVAPASASRPFLIGRGVVKLHLCRSGKAKDANIRQALIDRFGPVGTKGNPGTLYGIKTHLWAAMALAVYAHDHFVGEEKSCA
jgi:hypothetical protein